LTPCELSRGGTAPTQKRTASTLLKRSDHLESQVRERGRMDQGKYHIWEGEVVREWQSKTEDAKGISLILREADVRRNMKDGHPKK